MTRYIWELLGIRNPESFIQWLQSQPAFDKRGKRKQKRPLKQPPPRYREEQITDYRVYPHGLF